MNPASLLDRLSAQFIDLCILFLFSIGFSYVFGLLGSAISLIFCFLYFLLSHHFGGQTLGKKIIGLQVVSVNAQSLTFFRLFLRETVGRALCVATFLFGFIYIIFNKQHRGLHDVVSSSVVISEKKYEASAARFMGVLATVLVVCGFSVYYLLFKTPILATAGLHVLNSQGMGIGTLSGNIEKGWRIDTFYGSNALFHFNIKGIYIKHDRAGFFHRGAWRLQEVAVDEMKLRLNPKFLDFNYFNKGASEAVFRMPQPETYGFLDFKIFVDVLRIKKLKIADSAKLNLELEDIQTDKMSYEHHLLNMNNLQSSKTSANKLEVSQLVYNFQEQKLLFKAKLFAKKESYSILKKDLQASISWNGPLHKPERFRLITFDNRLVVEFFRNDLTVALHSFTPNRYILSSPSFKAIDAKLRNSNCLKMACMQTMQGRGSFYMNRQKIEFKNNMASFVGVNEDVLPFNYNDLVKALFTPRPVLSVVSEETLSNFVSQLYFHKAMDQLAEPEQALIKRDQVYFKVLRERFDPNRPRHIDTFLLRSPAELSETK